MILAKNKEYNVKKCDFKHIHPANNRKRAQASRFLVDLNKYVNIIDLDVQAIRENRRFNFLRQAGKKKIRSDKVNIMEPPRFSFKEKFDSLAIVSLFKFTYFGLKKLFNLIFQIINFWMRGFIFVLKWLMMPFYFFYKLFSIIIGSIGRRILDLFEDLKEVRLYRQEAKIFAQENIADKEFEPTINLSQGKVIEFKKIEKENRSSIFDHFRLFYTKRAFYFLLLLLLIILPFQALNIYKKIFAGDIKGQVLGVSEQAIGNMKEAGLSAAALDFSASQTRFQEASANFQSAELKLNEINSALFYLAKIAPDKNIRMAAEAKNILLAGQTAAEMGINLSLALNGLNKTNSTGEKANISEIIKNFLEHSGQAIGSAKKLDEIINKININNLPDEYKQEFQNVKTGAGFLKNALAEFNILVTNLNTFLGVQNDKRYLLVFQNNAEMRGSGGFVGSFALVDFRDGKIKNLEFPEGGSYDTKAGLYEKILSPQPLQLLGVNWRFWDANWWPDWTKSAKKLEWFYEKSDGPTVDGVIAITPDFMESLLKIIGPVDMKEQYGLVIDDQSMWATLQEFSEEKLTGEKTPKKIIGDLMNRIIEELPEKLKGKDFIEIFKIAEQSLKEKHIIFYFNDPDLQKQVEGLDWAGRIKTTPRDYLMVADTNIGGGKSDRKIDEEINHQASIGEDGSVTDILTVNRIHTAVKGEKYIGVNNVDWMRIYVPKGSVLIEASGFEAVPQELFKQPDGSQRVDPDLANEFASQIDSESGTKIYEESGYTVFANWSQVKPGQTATIKIKYLLPFKIFKNDEKSTIQILPGLKSQLGDNSNLGTYSLLIQKQPGAKSHNFRTVLMFENLKNLWAYPDTLNVKQNGWSVKDVLDGDKYYGMVLVKK